MGERSTIQLTERHKGRLLVVDDDIFASILFEEYLVPAGYEVIRCRNGVEALEKAAKVQPDLVILDIVMPHINGYEVCRQLRKSSSRFLPIILVTAMRTESGRMKAIDAGADDILRKPVAKQELLARVENLLQIKRLQDLLIEKNQKLQEEKRSRQELTEMILHDLQNPLAGLKGSLEFLDKMTDQMTEGVLRFYRVIKASTLTLSMILQCLEDVDNMEANQIVLQIEPLDVGAILADVIETALAMEMQSPETDSRIHNHIEPGSLFVSADRNHLARVLLNLITNALRYAPNPDDRIDISAEIDTASQRATIHVSDTGMGISPQDLKRIFEKSFRAAKARSGYRLGRGLGLTFSKMAMEAMGGEIHAASEENKGATFSIVLPLAHAGRLSESLHQLA
jgi:signal transduction histidine kinase